jgi:hypothetical protein
VNCAYRLERDDTGQWRRIFLRVVAVDKKFVHHPPRTKKNHGINREVVNKKTGARFTMRLPSKSFADWEKACIYSLYPYLTLMVDDGIIQRVDGKFLGLTDHVNVEAKIYRDRNVGDTTGFQDAIGDMLETAGVIANDRQIDSWNGTERLKDPVCPRLELCITFLAAAAVKKAKKAKA